MKSVVVVLLLACSVYPVQRTMDTKWGTEEKLVEELMYFPTGNLLKKLVMGYDEIVADLVWLRMIQYYGHHRQSDKRFDYLGHILDVLTDLDPRFVHAYTFGALLLTDDANNPARGLAILEKGAVHNRLDWRLPFMSGFINYVFLENHDGAGRFFAASSSLPGAPDFVKRFAAFMQERTGDVDYSLQLWLSLYDNTENEYERVSALRYIQRIHVRKLTELVGRFKEATGNYPGDLSELLRIGLLDALPTSPDGSHYGFDRESGRIVVVR